jgi:hypothetical protein
MNYNIFGSRKTARGKKVNGLLPRRPPNRHRVSVYKTRERGIGITRKSACTRT